MSDMILPREVFGSKLGLILGNAGKDTVRYTIIYKVKPVKEMMVRYGVCHKACAKEHIVRKGSIIMLKIDSGLFGLDFSGMLRQGQTDDLAAPPQLMFDGFRGIEPREKGKYQQWVPDWEAKKWVPSSDKEHTYYPFKDGLLPMPKEILHDDNAILIPATEAVAWMVQWLKRTRPDLKVVMSEDHNLTLNTLGARSVNK